MKIRCLLLSDDLIFSSIIKSNFEVDTTFTLDVIPFSTTKNKLDLLLKSNRDYTVFFIDAGNQNIKKIKSQIKYLKSVKINCIIVLLLNKLTDYIEYKKLDTEKIDLIFFKPLKIDIIKQQILKIGGKNGKENNTVSIN